MKEPRLIVITAPSGAGKTTIVRHLLQRYPDRLVFSVSATTRAKRPHETDGIDYYFLDQETFRTRIQEGAFAEWEEVYAGQYYGTLKSEIERILSQGKSILFDIDVAGAKSLKAAYPDRCHTIFVKPPSLGVLAERLRQRQTEDDASFKKRVDKAAWELGFAHDFDHILVNEDLSETLKNAESLVEMLLDV